MIVPLKVSRSTIAVQSLGSVKVLVQPPNDSLEAMATALFSSRSVNTWNIIAQTGTYIGAVFTGRASGNQIAGPLGIINVSGQVATSALNPPGGGDILARLAKLGLALLSLAAVLSVAVGFVNLLPIPILDGGHLLFYGIEAARDCACQLDRARADGRQEHDVGAQLLDHLQGLGTEARRPDDA